VEDGGGEEVEEKWWRWEYINSGMKLKSAAEVSSQSQFGDTVSKQTNFREFKNN